MANSSHTLIPAKPFSRHCDKQSLRVIYSRYDHLPFGVSSAPGIFQPAMETLLQGIQNVVVCIDDILVSGTTEEVHLNTLNEVLNFLEKAGLCLKKSKCNFMSPSVVFLRAHNRCSGSASLTGEGEGY